VLLDVIHHRTSRSHLVEQSGLGYLLSMQDLVGLQRVVPGN
jgi:hypothetical protein